MSETITPPNNRQYEGPAELLSDHHDERMLREEGRGIPMSYARYLTREYGPEGTGWDFDTEDPRHAQHNELEELSHGPEFAIATEGMHNYIWKGRYEDNDGNDLTGRVQRYVRNPKMGNVVLYPDGKMHQAEKQSR